MFKPTKFIFSCLVIALALSGCGRQTAKNNSADINQNAESQNTNAPNGGRGMMAGNGNFTAASSSDLAVGQKIMVMGAANADGSVVATQIIIGNADTDFSTSTFFRAFAGGNATGTPPPDGQAGQGRQARQGGQNGQAPDFSRFENMTEEERQQMRERMMAGGGMAGNAGGATGNRMIFRGANDGMSRLSGEIIDLDPTSLTLKLDDGGSKLVFYSPGTGINMLKPQ